MARKAKANPGDGLVAPGETGKLVVEKRTDEQIWRTLARLTMDPQTRNANLSMSFGSPMFCYLLYPHISFSISFLAYDIPLSFNFYLSLSILFFSSLSFSLYSL